MSETTITFRGLSNDDWYFHFKLPNFIMEYLWKQIEVAKNENIDSRSELAGCISSSLALKDPENTIINRIFLPLYNSPHRSIFDEFSSHRYRTVIPQGKRVPSNPILGKFWVNFQRKYEYNPLHDHSGMFSFVIWMKIPYKWEDEKECDWVKGSNSQGTVGNFMLLGNDLRMETFKMNPDCESHMLLFPSHTLHCVYPFYTSDDERISISGNIFFN